MNASLSSWAVIRWKKQGGLPKSVVDHCGGPCCVGKSFLNPSNWTWESDRLRSDHRGSCVQWIVVMNRAVKLTGSTADVNHWSHQCELEMVQHYPICGRQESLTRFLTSHKSRALGSLNKVLWGELSVSCQPSWDHHFCLQMKAGSGWRPWSPPIG